MRVVAGVWFIRLAAKSTRRSNMLLRHAGQHPWSHGWDKLWHNSVVYWITPVFPAFTSVGPFIYIGETDDMHRRASEHVLRLLAIRGATQQPFFDVVRDGETSPSRLKQCVATWLIMPVTLVQSELRKATERDMIQKLGTLNPPRVYSLSTGNRPKRRKVQGTRIFERIRPFKRLRPDTGATCPKPRHTRRDQQAWKAGLQNIASALSGHQFAGHQQCTLAAWRLSPSSWQYVAHRISNCEEGWRRKRGLAILQKISRVRRDLVFPITVIRCSMPWIGSFRARQIVLTSVKRLLRHWRTQGTPVPVLRHARLVFHWKRTASLTQCLSTADTLPTIASQTYASTCDCLSRQAEGWSGVVLEGNFHVATPQSLMPWPHALQHLATQPASITLPPTRTQILASLRDNLRSIQRRCRIKSFDIALEDIAASAGYQLLEAMGDTAKGFPISSHDIRSAKRFLEGFYVQYFDHYTTSLGAFCPTLVRHFARKMLDIGISPKPTDFTWTVYGHPSQLERITSDMAHIPYLRSALQPAQLRHARKSEWKLGIPRLLPKWKAPGLKWRLIIDKSKTPRNTLHSIICRCIDAALDELPRNLWSDCRSVQEVIVLSQLFNKTLLDTYRDGFMHWTESADMNDCFHHLPCCEAPRIWQQIFKNLARSGGIVHHSTRQSW